MQNPDVSQWTGRCEKQRGVLDLSAAQKLAATLGDRAGKIGDPMPFLAHWSAFVPQSLTSELSCDGHPKLGGFMPPVPLERRMWAAGALTFHSPLHIGSDITRQSTIRSVSQKEGAAGPMVFVTIAHEYFEDDTHAISEIQDIVYLNIPQQFSPPKPKPVPVDADITEAVPMSETLLFRYSAATFNAHRIHYDLPYAQEVEKYPGLVVHGPLQATLLMRAALRQGDRQPKKFSFRGIHPMFHFDDLHIFGHDTDNGMTLCTGIVGGHQGMQANIIWEEKP
ncbi:MaoC family dehydratase N-terminal domain-containing protein [Aestuariibius sp. HNIBRBA575]|uniref:FAS1-like dehydratase domain-containing protein n=1 Tax=Aestuariibius sp. HNIBRBA575 TaxID=3233343 RepID=UPI0034A5239D